VISDENRLPKTVAGLFGTAGALYARRAGLYLALAGIAFVVQYVIGVLLPHSDGLITGLNIIIDAYFIAAVSIGVAFDLAGKEADWSTVLLTANERWGVVSIVSLIYWLVESFFQQSVFGSPDDTGYGFLILPVIVLWGAVSLGQVAASIEPRKTTLALPFLAVGKGVMVAFRWVNFGRLVLLSLIIVLPTVANAALATVMLQHHVPEGAFWASIPLDALTLGPLQALSTVFYVDFLRRARP
jgi:hypothetical protein